MQQSMHQHVAQPSTGSDLATLEFDDSFTRSLVADPETRNFVRQVSGVSYSPVTPTPVSAPRLLAWSEAHRRAAEAKVDPRQQPPAALVVPDPSVLPFI